MTNILCGQTVIHRPELSAFHPTRYSASNPLRYIREKTGRLEYDVDVMSSRAAAAAR